MNRRRAPEAGTWIAFSLLILLASCSGSELEPGDLLGPPGDPGDRGNDPAAPTEPDELRQLDCSDLDEVIGLSEQIAANAGVTRGEYPIVLAHGFFGFDRVGPVEYWNEADQALRDQGFAAYITAVEPIASSVDVRGPELARQIACIARMSGVDAVNLVGHSQGGLDARVVAADPIFSRFVASVTTVATPHRGTLIADAALGLIPDLAGDVLDSIAGFWATLAGAPDGGSADLDAALELLSEAHSPAFNSAHPDNAAIPYFSWAGRSVGHVLSWDYADEDCAGGVHANPQVRDVVDPELFVTYELLSWLSGHNDGLVTVNSSRWGTFMGCIPADHADEIGLFQLTLTDPISGFNHREFLVDVASELADRGL